MNNSLNNSLNNAPELDTFETALLTELRREVAEHPAAPPKPVATRRSRRVRLGAVAATGVAASVVAVFGFGGAGGSPAYAVDVNSAGDVVITVHRLDDAAGLEQALRARGIDADVSYDASPFDGTNDQGPGLGGVSGAKPQEQGSQSGSDEGPSLSQGGGPGTGPQTSSVPAGGKDPCAVAASEEPPASLTHEGQDWVLKIPAGSPLLEDNRHLDIGTTVDATLTVIYAGAEPGSTCGVAQLSAPR